MFTTYGKSERVVLSQNLAISALFFRVVVVLSASHCGFARLWTLKPLIYARDEPSRMRELGGCRRLTMSAAAKTAASLRPPFAP